MTGEAVAPPQAEAAAVPQTRVGAHTDTPPFVERHEALLVALALGGPWITLLAVFAREYWAAFPAVAYEPLVFLGRMALLVLPVVGVVVSLWETIRIPGLARVGWLMLAGAFAVLAYPGAVAHVSPCAWGIIPESLRLTLYAPAGEVLFWSTAGFAFAGVLLLGTASTRWQGFWMLDVAAVWLLSLVAGFHAGAC